MKKVMSLFLAFTLMAGAITGLFSDVSFAESTKSFFQVENNEPGENLKYYEIIKGDNSGDLRPEDPITRQEFAVILTRLNGTAEEAETYSGTVDFNDVDKIASWAKNQVGYCKVNGLMLGDNNNCFNPEGKVTGEELAAILLRLLGYRNADIWGQNIEKLSNLTCMPPIPNRELKRRDVFEAVWPAISTNVDIYGQILLETKLKKTPYIIENATETQKTALVLAKDILENNYISYKDALDYIVNNQKLKKEDVLFALDNLGTNYARSLRDAIDQNELYDLICLNRTVIDLKDQGFSEEDIKTAVNNSLFKSDEIAYYLAITHIFKEEGYNANKIDVSDIEKNVDKLIASINDHKDDLIAILSVRYDFSKEEADQALNKVIANLKEKNSRMGLLGILMLSSNYTQYNITPDRLRKALKSLDIPEESINEAIKQSGIDWEYQAIVNASAIYNNAFLGFENYDRSSGGRNYSPVELKNELLKNGYTDYQAEYAVKNIRLIWQYNALRSALVFKRDNPNVSEEQLYNLLKEKGFDDKCIKEALSMLKK